MSFFCPANKDKHRKAVEERETKAKRNAFVLKSFLFFPIIVLLTLFDDDYKLCTSSMIQVYKKLHNYHEWCSGLLCFRCHRPLNISRTIFRSAMKAFLEPHLGDLSDPLQLVNIGKPRDILLRCHD